jgi:serine/threonine-protein kinase
VRSAADARRRFGATLALAGRLSGAPERVHLDVSLIDAGTSRLLRSFAIDTPAKEIGTLQDGLASRVLAALALETPEAARETLVAGKTASSGAYDLYVRGRGFLGRYEKVESLEAAITHFQQAIQQDPQYALAYAGLGEAYWRHYQLTKRDDSVELAKKTCAKALELNELLAPVHVTLGIVHRGTGHAGDAVGNFERALALDPANADARRELAGAYEDLGKLEEAEAEYRKAVEMRPEDWAGHNRLGAFLFRHGHYADAEREFRKVVSLVPDNVRGHVNLAAVLQLSGQESEALVELERSAAIRPTAAALTNLATLQFYRSEYRAAARTLERARALDSTDFRIWYGLAAAYYWAPGEGAKAGDAYRKAVERGESQRRVNPNDAELLAQLASCYAMIGQKSRARAFVSRALQLAPRNANVAFFAATVLEDLDQREAALSHLGRAIELGFSMSDIEREPTLVRLRTDPRYDLLRKRMKPATQ